MTDDKDEGLTAEEVVDLALALANGCDVDTGRLTGTDARAVWAIALGIIRWRREWGLQQPLPAVRRPMPPDQRSDVLRRLRVNPTTIVLEILSEPLLQAVLWGLAAGLAHVRQAASTAPALGDMRRP